MLEKTSSIFSLSSSLMYWVNAFLLLIINPEFLHQFQVFLRINIPFQKTLKIVLYAQIRQSSGSISNGTAEFFDSLLKIHFTSKFSLQIGHKPFCFWDISRQIWSLSLDKTAHSIYSLRHWAWFSRIPWKKLYKKNPYNFFKTMIFTKKSPSKLPCKVFIKTVPPILKLLKHILTTKWFKTAFSIWSKSLSPSKLWAISLKITSIGSLLKNSPISNLISSLFISPNKNCAPCTFKIVTLSTARTRGDRWGEFTYSTQTWVQLSGELPNLEPCNQASKLYIFAVFQSIWKEHDT